MPTRAPHPCATPSCPALITKGSHCPEHERKQSDRRDRDPAQAAFYSSARWTKLSRWVRARDPVCKVCNRTPSTQADHVDNDWRNNSPENWQGICRTCHAEKSGREHAAKRG